MKFFAVFAAIVAVAVARPGTSTWTLQELSDALQNPQINPAVVPILEHALNELMTAIYEGHQFDSIHVPLPAEVPVFPSPVIPSPVIPSPVVPSPVEVPAASTPLVQLIINVNNNQQVTDIPVPEVMPTPVQVVDHVDVPVDVVAVNPIEVNPVDVIAVNPVGIQPIEV